MLIRVLPPQVPRFWDHIKFAAATVEGMSEDDRQLYLTRLLHSLLNGKAQCFIRANGSNEIIAIAITRFTQDEVTGEKSLFLNTLFSFKTTPDSQWQIDAKVMIDFAKKNGCKKITTYSSNQRVFELAQAVGFTERFRCYMMRLEN